MPRDSFPKSVDLENGRKNVIRALAHTDFDHLLAFFKALPQEDRLFLRHDVRNPEVVRKWTKELDLRRVMPLIALDCDEIVANGSLHVMAHGWMQHVGHVRLVTARSHRQQGLGSLIAKELVAIAEDRNLEKLQAHVIADNRGAVKMFENVGFETVAVLKGMVKDQTGVSRDLAVMVNDVATLQQTIASWIQDAALPGNRAPGGGA